MAEIDNLDIRVVSNADAATSALSRLASSANRFRGAATGAARSAGDLGKAVKEDTREFSAAHKESGNAERSVRSFGNAAKSAGKGASKGAADIKKFWSALKRVAYYRFIRSVIKDITAAFGEGIKNLYHWSSAINGHFAQSMDRLATSTQYLKNSLGAMAAPLIESFIPVLDIVIDKIVSVLNFFNMLVAAVSGADTYTVAKKAAAVWDNSAKKTAGSAKSAADSVKRTLLGFDEINKLAKPDSSSGGGGGGSGSTAPDYGAMFEERPLTGIFKKISDVTSKWPNWLKWLLGVGTAVGIAAGIKALPGLLKKLYSALRNLVTLTIPNWLDNLFGGKGGTGGDGDYNVKVNAEKGAWEPVNKLMDLQNNGISAKIGLEKMGWNNLAAWMGNSVVVYVALAKLGWNNLSAWIGNSVVVHVALAKMGWNNLAAWIGNSVVVNVFLARGYSSLSEFIGDSVLVNVGLKHWGWDNISDWIGNAVTLAVALKKWGWKTISKWVGNSMYVSVGLKHWGWENIEDWIGTAVTVSVALRRSGWTTLGNWTEADKGLSVGISLAKNGWSTIANFVGTSVTALVSLAKNGWYSLTTWVGNSVNAYVSLARGNFRTIQEWVGSQVTVYVNLKMKNGGSTTSSGSSRSFGTATGGGGGSSGGGAGSGRHANGGIYSHGVWSNIPQYAGGTFNAHGSLFLAGEAGPEIVGHVGGRTEILNKSQLASTMYSSVVRAMAPVASSLVNVASAYANRDASDMTMIAEYVRQGLSEATRRQNELLQEQNRILREINGKEFVNEITTSDIQRAMNRKNVRTGVTVMPISNG